MLPFVNDGHERAAQVIRGEVEAKYAVQLTAATKEGRKVLLKKIKLEVQSLTKQKAPPRALY